VRSQTAHARRSLPDTKNGEDRFVPLNEALTAVVKDAMSSPVRCTLGLVFHRHGQPIKSICGTFASAYHNAGLTNFHFHDFHHMAVTTMHPAGIDLLTIMQITGYKTMAALRRYHAFDADDLWPASARQRTCLTNLAQPEVPPGMKLRKSWRKSMPGWRNR